MVSRKTAFNQIYKNSLLCYDLIKGKKRKTKQLEDILSQKDYESITAFLHTNASFDREKYLKKYPRLAVVDDVLAYTKDKYYHLKEVRDIVRLDNFLLLVLDDKLYLEAARLFYTKQIFELLDKEITVSFLPFLKQKEEIVMNNIAKNIDNYYIGLITS
jgi:hypothetical protein